jgi:hypothetical protein
MRRLRSYLTRAANRPWIRVAVPLAAAWSLLPPAAAACPSCYGASSGPVIDGMNLAVLVLIGVTGGVCSGIVAFAVRVVRRERQ